MIPLLLALLALILPPAVDADVEEGFSSQYNVVEWLRENGGYFNEKQRFGRGSSESAPIGVFASQDIPQGEVLTTVPWKCVIATGTGDWSDRVYCDTVKLLVKEMRKGDESFFGPYVNYLLAFPPFYLPTDWTIQGRTLLKKFLGKDGWDVNDSITRGWIRYCGGSADDAFEIQAAMLLASRGDDDTLTPVYDMYNHHNGKCFNTESYHVEDVKHEIRASRTIQAGEEIYLSYSHCTNCFNRFYNYGTPEIFRDYAFVENYPQRWIFHEKAFGFDVDEDDNGKLQVTWLDGKLHPEFEKRYKVTKESVEYLVSEISRINQLSKMELQPLLQSDSNVVP